MFKSSGQYVEEFILDVECKGNDEQPCDFSGDVDAWSDPELDEWGWVCPECELEHVEDIVTPERDDSWLEWY